MTPSALDVSARLCRVLGTALVLGTRAVWRAARRRPVGGPALLREALERLSGSFLKFGQILSLQVDTLPREYCDALLGLLDRVPPFAPALVDRVVREELGAAPRDVYEAFDPVPVASASIGQVHRAVRSDGRVVAVKVQRPGVHRVFEQDLALLRGFIAFVRFFRVRRLYFLQFPVQELSEWTLEELDYRREAANADVLALNARHSTTARVPAIHWDLTTRRVLTMDFLEGPSVTEYLRMVEEGDEAGLSRLADAGVVPATFGRNIVRNFLDDAFRRGVFHADLHPANLIMLPDSLVGYVDFGIVASLSSEARRRLVTLTHAFSTGDPAALYDALLPICQTDVDSDLPRLRRLVERRAGEWYADPAIAGRVRLRVSVSRCFMDLLAACRESGVVADRAVVRYIRAVYLADGLVSRIAKDFDLAQALREVVGQCLVDDARRQLVSRGAAMLAVTARWLRAGPAGVVLGTNRVRQQRDAGAPGRGGPGARGWTALGVWAVLAWSLALSGLPGWSNSPALSAVVGLTTAAWTVWVWRLLRPASADGR